jgi:death-on-curing protein
VPATPRWLTRLVVEAIHFEQLREHGGLVGPPDEAALEAALARPQNKLAYDPEANLLSFAAAYGFGLVRNHPFRDGNKRIGFLAMVTFLRLNGVTFAPPPEEVVSTMVDLAGGKLSEAELEEWICNHSG